MDISPAYAGPNVIGYVEGYYMKVIMKKSCL